MNDIAQWLALIVAAACIARLLKLRRQGAALRRREVEALSKTDELFLPLFDRVQDVAELQMLTLKGLARYWESTAGLSILRGDLEKSEDPELLAELDRLERKQNASLTEGSKQMLDLIARAESNADMMRAALEQLRADLGKG